MNISDTYCAGPLASLDALPLGMLPQVEPHEILDADELAWDGEDDPFQTCDFGESHTLAGSK